VRGRHGGGSLGCELVKLAGGDALVDPRADLLRDEDGVAVLLAEPVAELLEPRGDLVEVHHLVAAVPLHHVHPPPARTSVERLARARSPPPPRWMGWGLLTVRTGGEARMKMGEDKRVGFRGRFKRLPCAARRAIIKRSCIFPWRLRKACGFWNGFRARARSRFPRGFGVVALELGWWEAQPLNHELWSYLSVPATREFRAVGHTCQSDAGVRESRSVLHELGWTFEGRSVGRIPFSLFLLGEDALLLR
jgi:hypothetical protein